MGDFWHERFLLVNFELKYARNNVNVGLYGYSSRVYSVHLYNFTYLGKFLYLKRRCLILLFAMKCRTQKLVHKTSIFNVTTEIIVVPNDSWTCSTSRRTIPGLTPQSQYFKLWNGIFSTWNTICSCNSKWINRLLSFVLKTKTFIKTLLVCPDLWICLQFVCI